MQDEHSHCGWVYFVRAPSTGHIKIGYSTDFPRRLKALQNGNADKLEVLRLVEGTPLDERDLHLRFAQWRLMGEWFRANHGLLSLCAGTTSGVTVEHLDPALADAFARGRREGEAVGLARVQHEVAADARVMAAKAEARRAREANSTLGQRAANDLLRERERLVRFAAEHGVTGAALDAWCERDDRRGLAGIIRDSVQESLTFRYTKASKSEGEELGSPVVEPSGGEAPTRIELVYTALQAATRGPGSADMTQECGSTFAEGDE